MMTLRSITTAEDPESHSWEIVDIIEKEFDGAAVTTHMLDQLIRQTKRFLADSISLRNRKVKITITCIDRPSEIIRTWNWTVPISYKH